MRQNGFTLIELLVVMVIISIVSAMVLSIPKRMESDEAVRSAAHELAGVLRQTRERAVKQRSTYAVSFNICNEPGSSGRILNNRSGGHWYRVLGPDTYQKPGAMLCPRPPLFERGVSSWMGVQFSAGNNENAIRHYTDALERSWIGEPVRLPPRKVRFLALTDQDNGDYRQEGLSWPFIHDSYAPTYPRPWFGWYDQTTQRLYPWGGYDPALPVKNLNPATVAGKVISPSGFFYEGYDGTVSGCVNPSDRLVCDDTNNDGMIRVTGDGADNTTDKVPLWKKDDPRPLIDAKWSDFLIIFRPDGSTGMDWMRLRHELAKYSDNGNMTFTDPGPEGTPDPGRIHLRHLGPFDRCNRLNADKNTPSKLEASLPDFTEATSFVKRTGYTFITLAPDATDDADQFGSAQQALRSITPAYRVAVGVFGDIQVLKVRSGDDLGRTLSTRITGSGWQSQATTDTYYRRNLLTKADGSPDGIPVTDVVTTDMMTRRAWWWEP